MALSGKTTAEKIWYFLKAAGMNDYGTAGTMANINAESALRPDNLQNTYEKKLGMTDAQYVAAVDSGSYKNFVHDAAGFGLCQWTYWSRKQNLLNYAKSQGTSIADLEMQLGFLLVELKAYPSLLNTLKTATSVRTASDAFMCSFERPADQSETAKARRAAYGQQYFDQYAGTQAPEAEQENTTIVTCDVEALARAKIVATAKAWLGCKESDESHKQIIDVYNGHKPLARGYAVKYTDAWCSTYASAVAIKAGMTDVVPTECGCEKHIQLFKNMGAWQESDAYTPKPADYIFYDWDDNGVGDCTGNADHVGIVCEVASGKITVIEGNMSDKVGYRTIEVDGRYIRGYGVPDYAKTNAITGATATLQKKTNEEVAREVIAGKWGNGAARKQALTAAGYDYSSVQGIVDKMVAGTYTEAAKKDVNVVADEVIAGKWGNGDARKQALTAAGYNYTEVQNLVNQKVAQQNRKKSNAEIAKEVYRGEWGNGAARKQALTAAGYDYAAIQKIVDSMF